MPFQGEQSDHLNKCHCDGFTFLKHWTKKESSLWLRKCPRQCTHQHKEKKSIQSKERNKSFVKGFILQLLHFPSPHSILLLFQTIPDPALRGCFVFFFFLPLAKLKLWALSCYGNKKDRNSLCISRAVSLYAVDFDN